MSAKTESVNAKIGNSKNSTSTPELLYGKMNYILMALGAVFVLVGFILTTDKYNIMAHGHFVDAFQSRLILVRLRLRIWLRVRL